MPQPGLEPTYEGLKPVPVLVEDAADVSLEPTYEGLKLSLTGTLYGGKARFGAYL